MTPLTYWKTIQQIKRHK